MINERILNEFREHNTDPRYIVLITDMQNGEPICNEESLIISTKQIYTSLEEYLQNPDDTIYKTIKRDLTIYSNIGLNDNNLYIGELNGYISKENVKELQRTSSTESSHWIEIVDTVLQKTIDITFNRAYKQQPKIYITIDEKFEYLYRNYTISPIDNGEEGDLKEYLGVKITFNNLKNTNTYPPVGVVIIGDEKTEEYDDEGNIKPSYYNLTVNLYREEIDKETGRLIQIPMENTSILINDEEFVSNNCGTITASFEEGEYEITVKESGYRYTPEIVNLSSDEVIGLKLTPGITATFQTNLEDSDGNTIKLAAGWDGSIDWGDGETSTFKKTDSFPGNKITHTYNDEETEHTIFIETSDFKGAFSNNQKLIAINIFNNTIKEFSVDGAFGSCNNLSSVIINAPIKTIPTGTFWACNFEEIILPDSIENINTAFGYNYALNNIVFPQSIKNLNLIGACFTNCDNLNQIVFPESITNLNIGENCFAGCDNLNQIVFPESITNLNIGGGCFSGCTNLSQIVFPESIVNISINGALLGGTSVQQIILPKTVNPYILPSSCIADSLIQQVILSDSITQLDTGCIYGGELHQISLPKSIGVLSDNWCSNSLSQVALNWTNEDIIPWRTRLYSSGATLIIPPGTRNNYIAKGYPGQKLVERVSDEDDSD